MKNAMFVEISKEEAMNYEGGNCQKPEVNEAYFRSLLDDVVLPMTVIVPPTVIDCNMLIPIISGEK